jgi:hypothetical protein
MKRAGFGAGIVGQRYGPEDSDPDPYQYDTVLEH